MSTCLMQRAEFVRVCHSYPMCKHRAASLTIPRLVSVCLRGDYSRGTGFAATMDGHQGEGAYKVEARAFVKYVCSVQSTFQYLSLYPLDAAVWSQFPCACGLCALSHTRTTF